MNLRLKITFKNCYASCVAILSLFFISSCSHKQEVDLIVHNAMIYTVDSAFTTAQSFAVKDGKFIAVGTNEEILNKYESDKMIDAQGKAVFPGLIDSHCHFYGYGRGLQELDLTGTKSFAEVIEKVKAYAKTNKSEWIIGRGWDQNDWADKNFPERWQLDSLFPNRPVFLQRVDGHAVLVNNAALKRAGIQEWRKVEGGSIQYTAWPYNDDWTKKGKSVLKESFIPTGILIDNAVSIVEKIIPKPTKEEIKTSLLAAQKNCFAVGLTTVDDAGLEKNIINEMNDLQTSGELKMRIYAMLTDNKENMDYYLKNGIYKTDRLDVRAFKFYADGALGSRGACLLQPYSDRSNERGFLLNTTEHFASAATELINAGFQMNTHCIGDSAVHLIAREYKLAIFIKGMSKNTKPINPKEDFSPRWRIEHFQVTTKEDIRFLSNVPKGWIIPSVQPTHATSDMYWAKDRLGPDRIKYAYAYNDLLKAAGMLALGTDFPVENINPMYTFYAAVARKDLKGFPEDGFQPENALSRENTLRGMTIWGAYANFEEKEKGSIEAGKFADFVILDTDIMKCAIDKVPTTQVVYTFVNGENVYNTISN